jgi:unsaturated rhamnogalacturonyl hydrolase
MRLSLNIGVLVLITASAFFSADCRSQNQPAGDSTLRLARIIGDSFLRRHPGNVTYDSVSPNRRWNYEQGLILDAFIRLWKRTGDTGYFNFVKQNLDHYITPDGSIESYHKNDYSLDNIEPGCALLAVYDTTRDEKYRRAAALLLRQLVEQPRTNNGGFWHKNIYPHQMWLDGLYMAEPFYAGSLRRFGGEAKFGDITAQFLEMYAHAHDPKTGLLWHGWDERREQKWADRTTGCSSQFWARAIGWYLMGLIDVLDDFPAGRPERNKMVSIVQQLASAVMNYRDTTTNLWYQVVDRGPGGGNYLETSASAMFSYAFAKGARKGYLTHRFRHAAEETFHGLLTYAIRTDNDGSTNIFGTCRSAGLGGDPYRDGSFGYYVAEPLRTNDLKGIGAVLFAAIELAEPESSPGERHETTEGGSRK